MAIHRSKIGYCDFSGGDANVVLGCTPASDGCANCYARAIMARGGRDFSQVRYFPDKVGRLAKIKLEEDGIPFRRGPGSRPIVFLVDMGDLFHLAVPDIFIRYTLDTLADRPDVDWLLLTKRADRMARVVKTWLFSRGLTELPNHIWPGATVESRKYLSRIAELRAIPSRRRWLSVEPMLEKLDSISLEGIAWVTCGAESGVRRRRFDHDGANHLRALCHEFGIPFFGKQDSGLHPGVPLLFDGKEVKEFPRE